MIFERGKEKEREISRERQSPNNTPKGDVLKKNDDIGVRNET